METANTPALLLLNLPSSALAGINLLSFTTTPRFRGIKDLPHGLHFAFVGANAVFSERHGLWVNVGDSPNGRPPVQIAKWDVEHETLVAETEATEILRWRANLGEIWREGLTPYRQSSGRTTTDSGNEEISSSENDWSALTSCITPALLDRICGGHEGSGPDSWTLGSGSSARQDIEAIPGLSTQDVAAEYQASQILHFLPINLKQTWRPGATGRERTEAAQDRSWTLLHLASNDEHLEETTRLNEVLGELQFCFVMLLTLNNFSCLEQWKRLLEVILTSISASVSHPEFFVRALAALRLQLQHCKDAEAGLIDLADESGSLLSSLLLRFRRGLERTTTTSQTSGSGLVDVMEELDDLEDFLREQHGWQFGGTFARSGMLDLEDGEQLRAMTTAYDEDDEIGEFAPQIVELTAEQAQFLGEEGSTLQQDQDIVIESTDWGTRRQAGMGNGILVENRTVQDFVVDEDDDDDDEDDENDERAKNGKSDDEEDEDTQDLEDMDSRY